MRGAVLISNPPEFPTFELAYRLERDIYRFEIAYGTSFNELYYDLSPKEFQRSADRKELELQFVRVGLPWFPQMLDDLASGDAPATQEKLKRLIEDSQ